MKREEIFDCQGANNKTKRHKKRQSDHRIEKAMLPKKENEINLSSSYFRLTYELRKLDRIAWGLTEDLARGNIYYIYSIPAIS